MADLPTFTNLTAAQVKVMTDAFAPFAGATTAQAVVEYKAWLAIAVTEETKRRLRAKVRAAHEAEMAAAVDPVDTMLGLPVPPVIIEPPPLL